MGVGELARVTVHFEFWFRGIAVGRLGLRNCGIGSQAEAGRTGSGHRPSAEGRKRSARFSPAPFLAGALSGLFHEADPSTNEGTRLTGLVPHFLPSCWIAEIGTHPSLAFGGRFGHRALLSQ